jgi:predicted nucleic acid-binding protein
LNLLGNKAFCDTSFFFASLCPEDSNYEKAESLLQDCRDNAVTLCTTWDVISETVTLLRYRASYKLAVQFLEIIKPSLFIVRYDDSIRISAEEIFKKIATCAVRFLQP